MQHKDDQGYLSGVKNDLEVQTDSMSLAALKYGQHQKAYHAAIEDQRYLKKGGLEVKILTRAFRGFPNLKELTIDDCNSNIGSRQLFRDFDAFKAANLFTCDGAKTVPSLIQALSEAGVHLSDLRIGPDPNSETSLPNLFSSGDSSPSYPRGLCSKAMSIVFSDLATRTHAKNIVAHLRTLEISELTVENDRSDLLEMGKAIKNLIGFTQELESVSIMEIGSPYLSDMQPLSVGDLFRTYSSSHCLGKVTLHKLTMTDHLTVVLFIKLHARSLQEVFFHELDLTDVK